MVEYSYNSEIIKLDGAPSEVLELLDYWQSKCQADDIPLKKDIVPWELPKHLGRICIIEVTQNPLDFIYRVDGTNISISATSDLRNKSILDGKPAEIYEEMFEDLTKAADMCEPTLWHVRYSHDEFSYSYLRLLLPITKEKKGDMLVAFSYNLESNNGIFEAIR